MMKQNIRSAAYNLLAQSTRSGSVLKPGMVQSVIQHHRSFHNSQNLNLDLFSFFRSRKEKEQAIQQKPVKSTKSVIQDIESREAASETSETLKPVELEVIGAPPAKDASWAEESNGFTVDNAFPINTVSPAVDLELVKATIYRLSQKKPAADAELQVPEGLDWMKKIELIDFPSRFFFVKAVSKALNIAVPDNQLGSILDAHALYSYFATKVAGHHYDPKRPDAIYLDPKDFEGTNISIAPKTLTKAQEQKKWNKLVEQAKAAEEEALKKALEK